MTEPEQSADPYSFREAVHNALLASCDAIYPVDEVNLFIASLAEQGYRLVPDEPEHYVTFDQDGWFVEHSIICRLMGTIGTCAYNAAIRNIADEPNPDQFGRWQITDIDEGCPSLVRVLSDESQVTTS